MAQNTIVNKAIAGNTVEDVVDLNKTTCILKKSPNNSRN